MRFLHGYGHPLWCASSPGWICLRCALPRLDVLRIACPGGSPAAARSALRLWVQVPRVVRFWQGPRPSAFGALLADRLAGPRIGALQLPASHACARSALQKTIPETGLFFTISETGSQKRPFFELTGNSDTLPICLKCIHNSVNI